MNDEKILDEIKRSADDIEVPERLRPENIRDLIGQKDSASDKSDFTVIENDNAASKPEGLQILPRNEEEKTPFNPRRFAGLAAAVALFFIAVPAGIIALRSATSHLGNNASTAETTVNSDGAEDAAAEILESASADSVSVEQAFGGYFYTEDSLDNIRKILSAPTDSGLTYGGIGRNGFAKEGLTDVEESASMDDAEVATGSSEAAKTSDMGGSADYSTTNTREMDIDEGDIVKTDGKYIYIYKEFGGVKIIDITESKMKIAGEFDPEFADADDSHLIDLYVRDNTMVIIAETYSVNYEITYKDGDDTYVVEDNKAIGDYEHYMLGDSTHTVALTYDISDRSNPKKLGEMQMEGSYQTSRISGNFLYLFTWYHGNDIPLIGRDYPQLDSIYLPREKDVRSTYTMASVDLSDPNKAVDTKVIYSAGNDVYVTSDCIILEVMEYDTRERTNLFRFAYQDGKFTPEGVGAVPGYIESGFSIDEDSEGRIRVATTSYGFSNQSSGVYVFDKSMKRIGKLTGLAKGEDIKSARFLDDVLYLVTYENRDPLFTIDLSDPTKPEVIGKLKLPGFSDYLHFWDDTHLLGIGYDTDEETGEMYGAKLSMFDISDPTNVKEVSTITIKGIDNMPGMQNYKALLVNPDKNLIGFGTTSWNEETNWQEENQYMVYSFTNNTFTKLAAEKTSENDNAIGTRGVFAGDTFYIADDGRIRSYDMNKNFELIDKINLK